MPSASRLGSRFRSSSCRVAVLPPRRAVLAGFLFAWLFLPVAEYQFKFLPELNKMTVTSISVLLGAALFDGTRMLNFRPRWFDVPIGVLCLAPVASSLANGLGVYDGLSECLRQVLRWGVPYVIGRLYFSDLRGLAALAGTDSLVLQGRRASGA